MSGNRRPRGVSLAYGIRSVVLAPAALVVAFGVGLASAFTPLALLGHAVFIGVSCAVGVAVALTGLILGLICRIEGTRSAHGAERREAARTLGSVGVVLCAGAGLILVAAWLYVPTQMSYSPLWS